MATAHGEAYTPLAETAITAMLAAARADIERQYGTVAGAEIVVLGLGKLGSREMTLQSDLDLILICDAPDFAVLSNGPRPIDAERWFARLARRFISGLSAPTAEGELFEVDTRLRPSGNAGPLVTKRAAFESYQNNNAWTWEHMALTRARVLAGDAGLGEKVQDIIASVLAQPRDKAVLIKDVIEMRAKLRQHQPQRGPFDIRRGDGGLVDIEFIAQSLQLVFAGGASSLIGARDIVSLLDNLQAAGVLPAAPHQRLKAAAQAFLALRQIASLSLEDDETEPAPATVALLLEALNEPDMARLQGGLEAHRAHVAAAFKDVMEGLGAR